MSLVIHKVDDHDTILEFHKVIVHRFNIGDAEDPDIHAAQPLWEWENSEPGKFVMENAIEKPEWRRHINYTSYSYEYVITAKLEKKKLSEFYLRWGKIQ